MLETFLISFHFIISARSKSLEARLGHLLLAVRSLRAGSPDERGDDLRHGHFMSSSAAGKTKKREPVARQEQEQEVNNAYKLKTFTRTSCNSASLIQGSFQDAS
jgi:hypothetical protein